jgi:general secretion pathway protein E
VASSLMALLAQRLVRRVCMGCREPYHPTDEDLLSIGIDPGAFASGAARRVKFKGADAGPPAGQLFRAREGGCPACLGAGYKGRTAIYELLIIDEKIRQLAIKNTDAQTLKVSAVAAGMRTLREDGAQKVLAGMTTTAEVLMITTQDAN